MATNHTQHYQLNLWEPTDKFVREEFNENNQKIDAAIKAAALGNCRVETGTYVGTGRYGTTENSAVVLQLGYCPKLLFVWNEKDTNAGFFCRPCTRSLLHMYSSDKIVVLQWRDDSVAWWLVNSSQCTASDQLNESGVTYHYVAFS